MSATGGGQETCSREGSPSIPVGSGATTGVVSVGEKERSVANKRTNKSSFVRTGSFRTKHKVKPQDLEMSALGRGRSPGDTRAWRIRHFGYYDLQSVTVDRLSYQVAQGDPQQRLKKHTGASAALLTEFGSDVLEENHVPKENGEVGNNLVAPCPAFKNEIGNDCLPEGSIVARLRNVLSLEKKMRLCSRERVVLDGPFVNEDSEVDTKTDVFTVQSGLTFPLEFIDYGACYYRNYFFDKEHQNFVGFHEGLGPTVISLKREKVSPDVIHHFSHGQPSSERMSAKYQYRVILRTSEIPTLRGTLMEESIPSSIRAGSNRGIPPRVVIDFITQGELQNTTLKLAKCDEKTQKELMRLDEQELNNRYKVGVLYCKAGQTNEEEWYNNEHGSPAFDEFLELIGDKVKMKGFNKYRAQLDNKTDTTGEYSVFTEYENSEVMFHISTLLPFTPANKQQLLRKRHIGNDIVTLIFQEPGSEPFSPKSIRSHFQHIFIVVRVKNPNTDFTEYKVAVSRSNDVPYFGPAIPETGTFQKSEKFRNFILAKLINACNAALHSDKLYAMATRTRKQYLSDLCKDTATSISIDQAGGGALGRLFSRKRDRVALVSPLLFTPGAMTWNVSIIMRHWKPLPFSEEHDFSLECTLCLAPDVLTIIDSSKVALLHIPTRDITGFSQDRSRLNLFYDQGFCISLECHDTEEDVQDFTKRLMALSQAQEAILLEFGRSVISGLLGFTIDQDGTVVKVDGLAKMRGLQRGARVLQVEDKLICCNPPHEIENLLHDKNRSIVRAFVIPPIPKVERPRIQRSNIDWEGVWSIRPHILGDNDAEPTDSNHEKNDISCKRSPPPSHATLGQNDNIVNNDVNAHPKKYNNEFQHYRKKSRPDHLQVYDPYQEDENIYDRLISYGSRTSQPGSPSAKSTTSTTGPLSPSSVTSGKSYSRLKVSQPKAIRQSVLQLANNIMDHHGEDGESGGERYSWTPQAADHHIEVSSPYMNTHVTQSTHIPDRRYMASPLSVIGRKPPTPGALGEKSSETMPQIGQVQELTRRFSQYSNPPQRRPSRKSSHHVPITVGQDQHPMLHVHKNESKYSHRRHVNRPLSWDATEVLDNEPVIERERGESLPPPDRPLMEVPFHRNAQVRQPFRQKVTPTPPPLEFVPDSPMSNETGRDLQLTPQASGDDSPTKLLDEVLEQFEVGDNSQESVTEDKISAMSVRARTQLWELKAYTQTLPRSFKARTKSQPCSPLKSSAGPTTPTGRSNQTTFTFNHVPKDTPSRRSEDDDESENKYFKSRGTSSSVGSPFSSPQHRTLPLPVKPSSLATRSHTHNGIAEEDGHYTQEYSPKTVKHKGVMAKRMLHNTLSDASHQRSPRSQSEKRFQFDQPMHNNDQLSWDSVMGDITSYCRSVAEWVKQTENAGVLDGSYSPPPPSDPPRASSPTLSDASFTSNSVQSEPAGNLKVKVEELEDRLEKESVNNKELRMYLKKMEKQITDLQRRQSKVLGGVGGTNY